MYAVKPEISFPNLETKIRHFWQSNEIEKKGLSLNKGKKPFVFYDGPPFATGLPHYGHLLAGIIKDIVPRYYVMKGFYVERRWGWDCHGLPVEYEMEKELGLSGRNEIEKFGIARFNESCRQIVLRYTKEWKEIVERTGRWVDFENSYRTMDTSFMESVWWVFKELWNKGYIFEGKRVMPYSWRISTPLSNFEAGLNYRDVQDPAITVRFRRNKPNSYFLAWTTTPWTLPANLALAVHPEIVYVELLDKSSNDTYILAKGLVNRYFRDESEYKIIREMFGRELNNEPYEPLFDYFIDRKKAGAFRVLVAEFVNTTDGSGIVHIAPAFGEDDFNLCEKEKIEIVDPVDREGKFTEATPDLKGIYVKDADKIIIKNLKSKALLVRHETVTHSYPFCWRSDTPLIYKAISTWFLKIEPIKKLLIKNNLKTHWVPEFLRDGRFGNWLENARDWNISRNRFWGTPIPVWKCKPDCGEITCIGSISELENRTGKKFTDIHKHFIDDATIICPKCASPMKRIEEVFDCWFESGSMPYGQQHYPFENKDYFEKNFPADFIAEGIDQTRGWFYTLFVLSSALFDKPPFKNVIVNGLVLAEDGKKMSKRLKNYPDPLYILDNFGADALRAYLVNSPASHALELRFSENGVKDIVRSVLLPLWNAYSFFVTYALADGWKKEEFSISDVKNLKNDLDRWIISRLQTLIKSVNDKMAEYHLYEVIPSVLNFIEELTNWYIRLNRRRFWEEEKTSSKKDAYSTLFYVLKTFSKTLAPILPFISEEIYQNLRLKDDKESVHLSSFPEEERSFIFPELEKKMSIVRQIVALGRVARNSEKIKIRQPLRELLVISKNNDEIEMIKEYSELISQETNVKNIAFSSEEEKWVDLLVKPNAKILGPKLGNKMKTIIDRFKSLEIKTFSEVEEKGGIEIDGVWIDISSLIIERKPKRKGAIQSLGHYTIWLDTNIDDQLLAEGLAREFVNRVQKLRKELNFEVTDRILIYFSCDSKLKQVVDKFSSYLKLETLSQDIIWDSSRDSWHSEQTIENYKVKFFLKKLP